MFNNLSHQRRRMKCVSSTRWFVESPWPVCRCVCIYIYICTHLHTIFLGICSSCIRLVGLHPCTVKMYKKQTSLVRTNGFSLFFLREFDLWLTFGRSVFNPTTYIYESNPVRTIQSGYKHRPHVHSHLIVPLWDAAAPTNEWLPIEPTVKFIFSLCMSDEEDGPGGYKGTSIVWVCTYGRRDTTAESSD